MFIVNQNRTYMQNLDRLAFIEVRGCQIITEVGSIAVYKTEERAKEVFKEMIKMLAPSFIMCNLQYDEDMFKNMPEMNIINCSVRNETAVEKINWIYKMPLE